MPAAMDFTGQRFGRLVAVRSLGFQKGQTHWLFLCDCGTEKDIDLQNVRRGGVRSCGCLQVEQRKLRNNSPVIHGKRHTPEYGIWRNMKSRCTKPDHKSYADYGGRGIQVCERWVDGEGDLVGFECFLADMGNRPSGPPRYTLERINNDGPYAKDNCCWATYTQQARNRRSTRKINAFGQTYSLAEASEKFGLHERVIAKRLARGFTPEEALSLPRWRRPR